jgi:hypothetical protein
MRSSTATKLLMQTKSLSYDTWFQLKYTVGDCQVRTVSVATFNLGHEICWFFSHDVLKWSPQCWKNIH